MAVKQRSAFTVYKQLKNEGGMEESEESSISVVEEVSASRKRKERLAKKMKKQGQSKNMLKKRKLADRPQEDVVTKSKKKSKHQSKSAVEELSVKKQKKLVTTQRLKTQSSSEEESEEDTSGVDEIMVNIPFRTQFIPDVFTDSREAAKALFRLLIHPVSTDQFFRDVWEKKPVVVHRNQEQYNNGWFSAQDLDTVLRENDLEFGTNIDITTYEDGQRQTHNPEGRAHASTVWEFFQSGCSVRLLNPATYSKSVWLLNSTLQEYFNSCMGANIYLTPADSQGFAPHYDDIEAFVLQLEGRKHWRVYAPRNTEEMLPQYSSGNFSNKDNLGVPVIDTILEPGDLLYFPRGFIHQANTLPESHSLHITVSTYQKHSWGTVIEKLLPSALEYAMKKDVDFRRGLPLDCTQYMGLLHFEKDDPRRVEFCEKIYKLMGRLLNYVKVDKAVDEIAADNIHSSLPPVLNEYEQQTSVAELGAAWNGGEVKGGIILKLDTRVRVIRCGILRLTVEDGQNVLYYTLQNSKIYREKELIGMQIHDNDVPAVKYLLDTYPEYVAIEGLPMVNGSNKNKVDLCQDLFDHGLLML